MNTRMIDSSTLNDTVNKWLENGSIIETFTNHGDGIAAQVIESSGNYYVTVLDTDCGNYVNSFRKYTEKAKAIAYAQLCVL